MNVYNRRIPEVLTEKELKTLINSVNKPKHKLGLSLMGYAGLRVSEMASLRVQDVNISRSFIRVIGKGNKERIVTLTPKLNNQVREYITSKKNIEKDDLLLGGTRQSWHYVVKRYSKESLNKDVIHCHTLRHTFGTMLHDKGIPLENIAELLGHELLDTTRIYAHISLEQKHQSVSVLGGNKITQFIKAKTKKTHDLSVKDTTDLIGRSKEVAEIQKYIDECHSIILMGDQGVGKSAILKEFGNAIYIKEYNKKRTLARILFESKDLTGYSKNEIEAIKNDIAKSKQEDIIESIVGLDKILIFDDITDYSKADKNVISKLSSQTLVLASSSKPADRKLFTTYVDIKPLKRAQRRLILSDMIHMNDHKKKERLVDDIIHQCGHNLKESSYMIQQLELGKQKDEIKSEVRESNQTSIAPILLIFVFFFVSFMLKSYTGGLFALTYAIMIVFRVVFMRFMLTPSMRKR